MTTIAAPATNTNDPAEGPQIRAELGRHDYLAAQIDRWSAEAGVDGSPGYPALDEIKLSAIGDGVAEMNADQARATAVGLHRFADQLTAMAGELDALGGQ